MGKSDRRIVYGICVLAVTVILLTVIHSGHAHRDAGPKKDAAIPPWKEGRPPEAAVPATGHDSSPQTSVPSSAPTEDVHSSAQTGGGPASEAPPVSQSLAHDLSAPATEEPSSTDSDQSMSQPQETASQRVGRRLRGH